MTERGCRAGAGRPGASRPSFWIKLGLAACLTTGLASCAANTDPGGRTGTPGAATAASTPIALAPDGRTLWVVNPDADSVSVIALGAAPTELVAAPPIPVGAEPWAVAVAEGGTAVVMNRLGGSLSFVTRTPGGPGFVVEELAVGAEPGGLALSADGALAYVTLSGAGRVVTVDIAQRRVIGSVAVGDQPWAVAVGDDGLVVVSHRLARQAGACPGGPSPTACASAASGEGREAWLTLLTGAAADLAVREVALAPNGFGFPNALEGLALSGDRVYVAHLLNSPAPPNAFNTSVSAGLSAVALAGAAPAPVLSLDLNHPSFSTPTNFPRAIAAAPDGGALYLALAGTDAVMGVDVSAPDAPSLIGFWPTGANPRGLAVSRDGATAYVMNYLSRDVSVLDLSRRDERREVTRIPLIEEPLPAALHRGKVLFNNANDPRLSRNGWISCASCHLDGGGDGTTWPREEGARQTMPLWSLAGTAPFHAAATRDELQDFEADIERFMAGVGLAPGAAGPLLGAPSAGGSPDLDALAAFVLEGMRPPTAPAQGAAAVARGRAVFAARGCQGCHAGPAWTSSRLPGEPGALPPGASVVEAVVHDVGTYDPAHDVTGASGFDTPTLLGLAYTAPYFHDGSAATLHDVLAHAGHSGAPLLPGDAEDLVAFLRSIDVATAAFPPP